MQQLVYRSDAAADTRSGEVFRIIETSARNNPAREITGFLVFAHDRFLQLVEGSSEALDVLLADLGADPRHENLRVLSRRAIERRAFPNWRMQRLSFDEGGIEALCGKLSDAGLGRTTVELVRDFARSPNAAVR